MKFLWIEAEKNFSACGCPFALPNQSENGTNRLLAETINSVYMCKYSMKPAIHW